MITILKTGKLLLPETAIDSWRHWGGGLSGRPAILGDLGGGLSNRSFLMGTNESRMVLRLNGSDSILPGADRHKETAIWHAASQQGIAAPLLYVDEQDRFLVSAYISNSLPSQAPFKDVFTDQAFDLLKRCHQLEVTAPTIDYGNHIDRYWQIIETREQVSNPDLLKQRTPMQTLLNTLINSNPPTGLCHHDPVVANFVGNPERLYLIDWEYAAHGMLVMDYAALAIEWQIDDSTVLAKTGIEQASLNTAKKIYRYLCKLWKEISS